MAAAAAKSSPPSWSHLVKTVTLTDWWLTKPETHNDVEALGVAGRTSHQGGALRRWSSTPILKRFDEFELETDTGVCVILDGYINKERTLENGFSAEIFDHFVIGFPHNWKQFATYCPKQESAATFATQVQEEVVKDSTEGHGDCEPQNCDSHTLDMVVKDSEEKSLSNKTITPVNTPSVEIPQELIIEPANEVLCARPPVIAAFVDVTSAFEVDPNIEKGFVVSTSVESSAGSKCLGVSTRRISRSMNKTDSSKSRFPPVNDTPNLKKGTLVDPEILDSSETLRKDIDDVFSENKKAVDAVDCDMKSKSMKNVSGGRRKRSKETVHCSEDTVLRKSKRGQSDQNVDFVTPKDIGNGILNKGKNQDDAADVNDDIVLPRTSMKSCRNEKKSRVNAPQKEASMTQNKDIGSGILNQGKNKDDADVNDNFVLPRENTKSLINEKKNKVNVPQKEASMTQNKDIGSGILNQGKNKDDADVNDNIVPPRTNMKSCKNEKKNRVNVPQKEASITRNKDIGNGIINQGKNKDDADADVNDNIVLPRKNMRSLRNEKKNKVNVTQKEANMTPNKSKTKLPVKRKLNVLQKEASMTPNKSKTKLPVKRKLNVLQKEASMTPNKSKTKLPVKRKLITSPKSTPLSGTKGYVESANIVPLESFSGKKSRSGRPLLPPLEYWRNQMLVYDKDRQVCGVQDPE